MNRLNSVISRGEADALKEMIFKRARERAQSLTEDVQNSYTASIQNDIMDLARDSFVANKNPFSVKTESEKVEPVEEEIKSSDREIGFSRRQVSEIKSQINYRNNTLNTEIVNNEVESNMSEARGNFTNKKSFMGALNFLNSQASVALIERRGKSFEAMA